jgi:general secretion pathway protein K
MNPQHRRRGQALVTVVFVVLILTVVVSTLAVRARRELQSAYGFLRETQQFYAAQGAVTYVAQEMQTSSSDGSTQPQLTQPPDTDSNGWTMLGDCWYKVEIIDTASRVNINTASAAVLAKLPPLANNPDLVAAIIDWRDTDDTTQVSNGTTTGNGAESDYYQSLNPPYNAKNAPFSTIEELLLVRGMTPQILYGIDPALSGVSDGTTVPSLSADSLLFGGGTRSRQAAGGTGGSTSGSSAPVVDTSSTVPLAELITTYSKERNTAADGTQRINVKTCTQQQLTALGLSTRDAQTFISSRGQNGANIRSIADLLGVYPGFTRTFMQNNADKLTVTDDKERINLINLNSAPAEVLATIPNVDQTVYNALVNARNSGTTFNTIGDLFSLTQLNRTQLAALVDNVCTKSSVYLVRIRVRTAGSPRIFAAEALVEISLPSQTASTTGSSAGTTSTTDTSSTTPALPKILQWREVGRYPGWRTWTAAPSIYNNTSTGGLLGSQ